MNVFEIALKDALKILKQGDKETGKEFTTLQVLIDDVRGRLPDNTVLDGELCIVDDDGNENFQDVMKVIKRKNNIILNYFI